jgi:glycosyltransferase involved in cell wall biosynthesis
MKINHSLNKAAIFSMKYAPGLMKEFSLMKEKMKAYGHDVDLFVADEYSWMDIGGQAENAQLFFTGLSDVVSIILNLAMWPFTNNKGIKSLIKERKYKYVIFYNFHPVNILISLYAKKINNNCKCVTYLHEPHMPDKANYGFKRFVIIYLLEKIQKITLYLQDIVIVPSDLAKLEYNKNFGKKYPKPIISPLMVPKIPVVEGRRKYFTIIGNDHPAKGFSEIFDLILLTYEKNLNIDYCIITRSKIEKRIRRLDSKQLKRVRLINKPTISDQEISQMISESYAVFKLDTAITQSGIIPLAYQYNTPVIVRDIPGFTQHVQHKITGYVVPTQFKSNDLVDAILDIKKNTKVYSRGVKEYYEDYWSPDNWYLYYKNIF